jgi:hypothetical protein
MDRYTPECSKLLAQYKTTLKLLGDEVPSLDAFVSEYRVGRYTAMFSARQVELSWSVDASDTDKRGYLSYSWIVRPLFRDSRLEFQLLWNIVQNKASNPPSGSLKQPRYAADSYPK